MLRQLVDNLPGPSHVFYLDVPLEETLRRHEDRPLRADIPPDKLRESDVPSDVLGSPGEVVINGNVSLDGVLQILSAKVGPVPPRKEQDVARFL